MILVIWCEDWQMREIDLLQNPFQRALQIIKECTPGSGTSMQESTNCCIVPYRMGEHGLIWENMENMENTNQISLNNSIYDSKHSIHYSKHSICQPNEGENHFHLHFRKFTTFYPWSSKCIMAKYTKYTIAKMKFSIWRHGVCEICKNIDSICPFMASRVTDTIYTPS